MSESREYYIKPAENGTINISSEVVLSIAAAAALEVEGVASMNTSFGTELQERFGKKNNGRGIRLDLEDDRLIVDCSIFVDYGPSIQTVAGAVQESVRSAVESMTGLNVGAVNVRIAGINAGK